MLEAVGDLVDIAGRLPASRVVLAGASRVEDLRLVEGARDHGIIDRVILVGRPDRIAPAVEEVGIEIDEENIVPADDDEQVAAATVEIVKAGGADIVLKGNISTPVINRHMLPLALRPTVSLVTVFDAAPIAAGRCMIMTDAGVTTVCNFGRLVDMVHNAVDVARTVMGIRMPRVAVLSANEKQVPSLPSTWLAAELSKRDWQDAVVYGPLSFDLATSPESVVLKGLADLPGLADVAGRADILVCPGIDSANILYKAISAMNKYGLASLASITVGFPVPYIILSRADSLETRLESIALCSVYSRRSAESKAPKRPPRPATQKACRVLVVNPGSMSMKVAVFEGERCLHEAEAACDIPVAGTPDERRGAVEQLVRLARGVLDESGVDAIDAVAGRGGF
ncbi:MAG: phosphate acyltransferase, partial [Phycisphaerae bacterium]